MAKKRSCRRTVEENHIHDQAVRIRKMTDRQIIDLMTECTDDGYRKGYSARAQEMQAASPAPVSDGKSATDLLEYLQKTKLPGIGAATIDKIMRVARENRFVQ